MAAMTNVAVPVSDGGSAIWTALYTAAGSVTVHIHNRTPNVDMLVRVNGSSTAASDSADAPAEGLNPGHTISIDLSTGDKVFAKPRSDSLPGRVTLRV